MSIEAEDALLGALILYPDIFPSISEFINANSFTEPANAAVWSAYEWLFSNGIEPDLVSLSSRLSDVNAPVGNTYLSNLSEAAPIASHAYNYALIIKDKQIRRDLLDKCAEISAIASDFNIKTSQLIPNAFDKILEIQNLKSNHCSIAKASDELIEIIYANQGKSIIGLSSGYGVLDQELLGIPKHALVTLAAESSTGKTTVGLNLALEMAKKGQKSLYVSLEVPGTDLLETLVAAMSSLDNSFSYRDFFNTNLEASKLENLYKIIDELKKLGLFFAWNTSGITELLTVVEHYRRKEGIDCIFIDHMQLLSGSEEYQVYVNSTKQLKQYALDHKVAIIALSQLNSQMKIRGDKDPSEHDLRGGKNLGQDSDIIMFLYKLDPEEDQVYLKIHKTRKALSSKPKYFEVVYHPDFRRVDFRKLKSKPKKEKDEEV